MAAKYTMYSLSLRKVRFGERKGRLVSALVPGELYAKNENEARGALVAARQRLVAQASRLTGNEPTVKTRAWARVKVWAIDRGTGIIL